MSAAGRLPFIADTVRRGVGPCLLCALASLSPTVRDFLRRYLYMSPRFVSNMWKAVALALAFVNLKNLPGFWHIRVLRGIIYQLYFQPSPQPPRHLFAPLITSSRNSLYDCDYNLHKSNSTYFADLDVARAHTVGCIIRTGLARLNRGDEKGLPASTRQASGKYAVALGAVSCSFQRQIEPLQSFEIWTRVLSWDRKWLYLISHVVKKGAIKPDSYVLQPWKKGKKGTASTKEKSDEEDLTKYIFATSVARYVFKKGRLTINPEIVLERSRLMPPRPEGTPFPPRAEASSDAASLSHTPATPAVASEMANPEAIATEVSERLDDLNAGDQHEVVGDDEWTWEDMEKERLRGLQTAVHFDRLNGAGHNELRGGDVLGRYADYW